LGKEKRKGGCVCVEVGVSQWHRIGRKVAQENNGFSMDYWDMDRESMDYYR
jgi:hypothetical protein